MMKMMGWTEGGGIGDRFKVTGKFLKLKVMFLGGTRGVLRIIMRVK